MGVYVIVVEPVEFHVDAHVYELKLPLSLHEVRISGAVRASLKRWPHPKLTVQSDKNIPRKSAICDTRII